MTNEEAKEHLKDILADVPNDKCIDWIESLNQAIKALEQQPSDDCISRAQALHACCDEWNKDYKAIMKSIRQLPSVTVTQRIEPQESEDEE